MLDNLMSSIWYGSKSSKEEIEELKQLLLKISTWHELNDVKTMQLVPTEINSEFGHPGGVGEINAGAFGTGGYANKQSEEIIK